MELNTSKCNHLAPLRFKGLAHLETTSNPIPNDLPFQEIGTIGVMAAGIKWFYVLFLELRRQHALHIIHRSATSYLKNSLSVVRSMLMQLHPSSKHLQA